MPPALTRQVVVLHHRRITVLVAALGPVAGAVLVGGTDPVGQALVEHLVALPHRQPRQALVVGAQPLADPHVGVGPGDPIQLAEAASRPGAELGPHHRQVRAGTAPHGPAATASTLEQVSGVADHDLGRGVAVVAVQAALVDAIEHLDLRRAQPPLVDLQLADHHQRITGIERIDPHRQQPVERRGRRVERCRLLPIDHL